MNITGSNQVATIQSAYHAKRESDEKAAFFGNLRENVIKLLLPKIYKFWQNRHEIVTGKVVLNLTVENGQEEQHITVSDRSKSLSFTPEESVAIMARLNQNIPEDKALKTGDVFVVSTQRIMNPVAMTHKKVRDKVMEYLVILESELKQEGSLAPEVSLVLDSKTIGLSEVAIPRLLAVSEDFEDAIVAIKSPISVSLVNKPEEK